MTQGIKHHTPNMNQRLGLTIKRYRGVQGLSKAELARRCGLTPARVTLVEQGNRVDLVVADRIGKVLGVELSDLVDVALQRKLPARLLMDQARKDLHEVALHGTVPWKKLR